MALILNRSGWQFGAGFDSAVGFESARDCGSSRGGSEGDFRPRVAGGRKYTEASDRRRELRANSPPSLRGVGNSHVANGALPPAPKPPSREAATSGFERSATSVQRVAPSPRRGVGGAKSRWDPQGPEVAPATGRRFAASAGGPQREALGQTLIHPALRSAGLGGKALLSALARRVTAKPERCERHPPQGGGDQH